MSKNIINSSIFILFISLKFIQLLSQNYVLTFETLGGKPIPHTVNVINYTNFAANFVVSILYNIVNSARNDRLLFGELIYSIVSVILLLFLTHFLNVEDSNVENMNLTYTERTPEYNFTTIASVTETGNYTTDIFDETEDNSFSKWYPYIPIFGAQIFCFILIFVIGRPKPFMKEIKWFSSRKPASGRRSSNDDPPSFSSTLGPRRNIEDESYTPPPRFSDLSLVRSISSLLFRRASRVSQESSTEEEREQMVTSEL